MKGITCLVVSKEVVSLEVRFEVVSILFKNGATKDYRFEAHSVAQEFADSIAENMKHSEVEFTCARR